MVSGVQTWTWASMKLMGFTSWAFASSTAFNMNEQATAKVINNRLAMSTPLRQFALRSCTAVIVDAKAKPHRLIGSLPRLAWITTYPRFVNYYSKYLYDYVHGLIRRFR